MSADGLSKLLEALAKLVGAIAWPMIFLFVLARFGTGIGDFISTLGAVTLKFAGFEASLTRRQNEAVAALTAAATTNPEPGSTPEDAGHAAKEAVRVVGELSPKRIRQIEGSKVLWVDDRPSNNVYERQALEALGVNFTLATSTEEALKKVATQRFRLIISDMGRPPDSQAGYTLLEQLRASGNDVPYIIYAGSRSPEHQAEARRRGAIGCTNTPTELFEMVLSILLN